MSTVPKLFRVTVEVADLDTAAALYSELLGIDGDRHPGARHYFDCDGVILAVIDVSQGGLMPTPGPKSLYFAVDDIDAVHARPPVWASSRPTRFMASPPASSSSDRGASAPSTSWTPGATTCASAPTGRSTHNDAGEVRLWSSDQQRGPLMSRPVNWCRRGDSNYEHTRTS